MNAKTNPPRARKLKVMESPQESSPSCSREDALARLLQTSILKDFARENNGFWSHQEWLALCDKISREGFSPIDFDQVGLVLEREKADHFAGK